MWAFRPPEGNVSGVPARFVEAENQRERQSLITISLDYSLRTFNGEV
jgi:hypothetical protein